MDTGDVILKSTPGPGYAREIYLDCPPDDLDKRVTERQVAVTL